MLSIFMLISTELNQSNSFRTIKKSELFICIYMCSNIFGFKYLLISY